MSLCSAYSTWTKYALQFHQRHVKPMHGRQVLYTFGPVVAWYVQVILTWSQPIRAMCGCKWVHLFFFVFYFATSIRIDIYTHSENYRYIAFMIMIYVEAPVQNYHYISIYIPYSLIHYISCMLLAGTLKHWVRSCLAKEVMPWKPWVTRNEETAAPNFQNV